MSVDVDVLILGAGPAGCAAAITCAAYGLRAWILERSPTPRDRPGETLHPGVEPLLERLGVAEAVRKAGFVRHAGHWVRWNDPEQFVAYGQDEHGPWRGFQATRTILDALLIARAEALGVEAVRPCGPAQLVVLEGRVLGVTANTERVTARYTVDATGSSRWLARQLGLAIESRSPRLIARYGYARGRCEARYEAPAMRAEPNGWSWTARVGADLYAWTRLAVCAGSPHERLHTPEMPPDELNNLSLIGRVRGCDVSWRRMQPAAGPGYFLTGDAAAALDPASSHGVLRALMSGMYAGHAIAQITMGRADEDRMQLEYRNWQNSQFEHDVSRLRELYCTAFPYVGAWFNLWPAHPKETR
jgi:flavin-dependent dehydrogenase